MGFAFRGLDHRVPQAVRSIVIETDLHCDTRIAVASKRKVRPKS